MKKPQLSYGLIFILLVLGISVETVAEAQVTFTDVTEEAGVRDTGLGLGVACGDYDDDGYLDVYVARGGWGTFIEGPDALYRNNGDGTFTKDEELKHTGYTTDPVFLDYDNDGDLDFCLSGMQLFLHRNLGRGCFTDDTTEAGLGGLGAYTAAFGDYDKDGHLDIYLGGYNLLYRNNSDGTFSDVTAQANAGDLRMSFSAHFFDYDNDGNLDIYVLRGEGADNTNTLHRNNGDGTFTEVGKQAGVAHPGNARCAVSGDYDNDGDLDIYLANNAPNVLYRNNSDGTFTEVTKDAGVNPFITGETACFGDYDSDGYLDLYVARWSASNSLYRNNRDGTFTDVTKEADVAVEGVSSTGTIFFDYDNDGDLDIFVATHGHFQRLYRNNGTDNNWLQVRLDGTTSNRDGIGARVEVEVGELRMMREVNSGTFRVHPGLTAYFGLGKNVQADTVEIQWPSGQVDVLQDVPANQSIIVKEGIGIIETRLAVQVTSISPQEGRVTGGEPIAIFGSGFPSGASVTIGGKPLAGLTATGTIITGVTPPGTEGEQDVLITAPGLEYSILIGKFTYNPLSNVVVTGIRPTNGKQAGGDAGSITGSGFLPGATVTIGGIPAIDAGVTPTLITFTIPSGTKGAKDVVVTNPDGQKGTLRGGYTYNPFPIIEKLRPRYGGPLTGGTEITITGNHFMEGVVVIIGEERVTKLDHFSLTELRLRTPPGEAGPKAVRVMNPDGQEAILEDGFTYNRAPRISSVKPNAGPLEGGTRITITGTRFISGADVLIGGAEASSISVVSSTEIRAETPLSTPGLKDVVVINRDGQKAELEAGFTYNPLPVITKVIPDNGRLAGGTSITIRGNGFLPGARVLISTETGTFRVASSIQVVSPATIMAVTPPGKPGPKDVVILNPDKQVTKIPEGFTYNPMPTITRITPDFGTAAGGTKLTVEGTGFLQGARVMVGKRVGTTMVKDDETIEAVTPPNRPGLWDVRVINPDTQEVVVREAFVSVGELVYNYPNPFLASQGTTFRYVTNQPVDVITVRIFNLRGVPIGIVRATGSNEVRWYKPSVHVGIYVYLLEARLEDGKVRRFKNMLEVRK